MMRGVMVGEDMGIAASICGKEKKLLKRRGGREYVFSPLAGLSLNLGGSGIIASLTEDEEHKTSSE
jgi:hypothetical protein